MRSLLSLGMVCASSLGLVLGCGGDTTSEGLFGVPAADATGTGGTLSAGPAAGTGGATTASATSTGATSTGAVGSTTGTGAGSGATTGTTATATTAVTGATTSASTGGGAVDKQIPCPGAPGNACAETCCFDPKTEKGTCAADSGACPSFWWATQCNDKGDCAPGNVCCATFTAGKLQSKCAPSCPPMQGTFQLCMDSNGCPANTSCQDFEPNDIDPKLGFCKPN